jgi:hypothetical protein
MGAAQRLSDSTAGISEATLARLSALGNEAKSHANISQIGAGARSLMLDLAATIEQLTAEHRASK